MTRGWAYGLAALAGLGAAVGSASAGPAAVIPAVHVPAEAPVLLLEVHVNGRAADTLAMLRTLPDGCDEMEAGPLRAAGLYTGTKDKVCLGQLPGIEYRLDREAARIEIFAEGLAPEASGRQASKPVYARQLSGLIGQYGLSAQHVDTVDGDYQTGFGDLSVTVHSGWGRLQHEQVASWDGSAVSVQRLATAYERDFPDDMTRLTVGDNFTRAPRWGRLSSFAGVQYGTDFSMDPDESFRPFRTFQTLLREQSEIDVRVNGVVRQRTSLAPGFGEVQIIPENGLNDIEIAIRDGNGLTRIEDASFFASTDALAPGVTDFSASLGVPRRFDGARSHYGDALLASGLVRRGLSDSVTAEVHGEVSEASFVMGGGAQVAAGNVGILNMSAGISESGSGRFGHVVSAGIDRNTRHTSLQLQARFAGADYADAASGLGAAFPDVSVRASAGIFTPAGAFRASYNEQTDRVLADRRFVSFGWEKGIAGNRATLAASGFHDLARDESGATLSLRMSFGAYSVRTRQDRIGKVDASAVEVSRSRLAGERLQWSVQAAGGEGIEAAQGDFQADLGAADLFLHAGKFGGTTDVSAGLRGGFTAMKSHFVLSRQTTPAAVRVHVPGVAGIAVYQDNRPVAVTDADGVAVIAGVRPFEINRVSLRPEDVPLAFTVGAFELDFVPRRGLAEVAFETRRESSLGFTVFLPGGTPLAPGSRVELAGTGARCPVGMDGRVFCASVDDFDSVIVFAPGGPFRHPVSSLRKTGQLQLGPAAQLQLAEIS